MHSFLSFIAKIPQIHDDCIARWQQAEIVIESEALTLLLETNHACNFQLWNTEDEARRDDLGFEYVYRAKRKIDQFNQKRNNMMEAIDAHIIAGLQPSQAPQCPVHSETPGMIIDRLSILSLKIHHMGFQATRESSDLAHREACAAKHRMLLQQRTQLIACLEQLISQIGDKTRTFKVYHQFKMYNDPALNPALYEGTLSHQSRRLDPKAIEKPQ